MLGGLVEQGVFLMGKKRPIGTYVSLHNMEFELYIVLA